MTTIIRKWKYISQRCEKIGNPILATLARQIDEEVVKIYGDEHTKNWKTDFISGAVDEMTITSLVKNAGFCTPCSIMNRQCFSCPFVTTGQLLYKKFVHELWML